MVDIECHWVVSCVEAFPLAQRLGLTAAASGSHRPRFVFDSYGSFFKSFSLVRPWPNLGSDLACNDRVPLIRTPEFVGSRRKFSTDSARIA